MNTYSFEGATAGPHLLITGGVHGDEFEPIRAVQTLISLFQNEDISVAGLCGKLTLVPCVNEAAFRRGHRCAEDELDLARTCPGSESGSITERTAFRLSQLIRAADCYIDLHSGGTEFSLFPLAGYVLHTNTEILNVQRRMARAFNLPLVWGTSPHLQGRSLSVARDADVPAIYCEYHGAATCDRDGIRAYVDGCLQVMTELELLNHPRASSNVRYVVEDDAPASGHLQVCNPSPVTGMFIPCVSPGDTVEAGQSLGTVYSLDDGNPSELKAENSGLVLMVRTFPRVLKDQSVGVVIELR